MKSEKDKDNFDFCIIGTGASGGILAYKLASYGFKTLSLDSGYILPNSNFTNDSYKPFKENPQIYSNSDCYKFVTGDFARSLVCKSEDLQVQNNHNKHFKTLKYTM